MPTFTYGPTASGPVVSIEAEWTELTQPNDAIDVSEPSHHVNFHGRFRVKFRTKQDCSDHELRQIIETRYYNQSGQIANEVKGVDRENQLWKVQRAFEYLIAEDHPGMEATGPLGYVDMRMVSRLQVVRRGSVVAELGTVRGRIFGNDNTRQVEWG
jgi:hypothetical protein